MRHRWLLLLGFFAGLSMVVGWSAAALAFVPPFPIQGRGEFRGYFTDTYDCGGHDVWPGGIPGQSNAAQFINTVMNKLQNGTPQEHLGAAFIIQTMLGGGDHTYPINGSPFGPQIDDWKQRVMYAESQGWIDWNFNYTYTVNTMFQGPPTASTDTLARPTCPAPPAPPPNPMDDAYFPTGTVATDPAIVFRNPTTGQFYYALRIACANPLGNLSGIPGLPPADYNLEVNLFPGSGTPAFGGIVEPGKTYHLTPIIQNFGPAASGDSFMDVNSFQPNYVTVHNSTITGGWAWQTGYIPGALPGPCNFGPQCWYYWYHSIPNGQIVSQTDGIDFQVSNATPDGQKVCFNAAVTPHNNANQPAFWPTPPNPALCFTVQHVHYPGIVSKNGDVHAGGDLCGQAQNTSGSIFTNSNNNSVNEYVVSANGLASNFGSNNTVGGSSATVGKNGNYYSVCRPDLVKTATAFLGTGVSGVDYVQLPGGNYDLAALPAVPGGVYYFTGPVSLHGTYTRKMTIVAPSVTITGDIILNDTGHLGKDTPSLGIIANSDITINGAAHRVDAYLFANGTINTCGEGNAAVCANTLTVNGFLMARTLSFRRLGPASSAATATVGEQVNLTGQIYINPPKFFDNVASVNALQHQGEKPPLN